MNSKIKYWIVFFIIIWFLIPRNIYAQQYNENEVKGAFLCNFAKFVEWPLNTFASSNSPIMIGIWGDPELVPIIENFASKMNIGGQKIQIIQCKSIDQVTLCHILYIKPSEKDDLPEIIKKVSTFPVLTVSETIGFCQMSGMINFSKSKNKYGFEINVNSAKKANLKISSKLLGLATIIE